MIKVGDEIRLVKAMGVFDNIGEVCEVVNVDDEIICFRFGGCHLGCMSHDEFEKYFEFVEVIEEPEDELEESLEARELRELFEWCKENDKPFYPSLYYSVASRRTDETKPILGMYTNRLCLMQFRDKTFKDSDFSLIKIMA